jgi:hypothetical protein
MAQRFSLPIDYNGEQKELPAQLLVTGYTHRFVVTVDELEIFFEPDEEGCYRAIKMPGQEQVPFERIDKGLLSAIQQKIQAILA